jgi:cysteine desulfurase
MRITMAYPIYLDNNATTPLDPRVLEAMLPYLREDFGNAASHSHAYGWEAERAVDQARGQVAALLQASGKEIIWTSGATESNNIAVQGAARMYRDQGRHIITQASEHKAVLDPCHYLEEQGFEVTYLPVTRTGRVDVQALRAAMRDDTILVSIMHANNEIGTLQPVGEIGALCKERGVLFHTDATQTFGKEPIDVEAMGIDLLSASGHKIYGPKGVGLLYVRRRRPRVRCSPLFHGGGHERGMRSGTLNVPGIVGMGTAAAIAAGQMDADRDRLRGMRDRLWEGLSTRLDAIYWNGDPEHGLANTLNVSFGYVEGESLMMGCPGIAVSSGSACTSASLEPSHVLRALGVDEALSHGSVRFSLGRFNTAEDIEEAVEQVVEAVKRLREMSPLYEMYQEGAAGEARSTL